MDNQVYKISIVLILVLLLTSLTVGCSKVSLPVESPTSPSETPSSNKSTTPPIIRDWQISQPQTNTLMGIWGSSETDVFAVGDNGTILHYDGKTWNHMISGTNDDLRDVWGTSPSDVYAIGYEEGTILHYDGIEWNPMNSGTKTNLYNIWGSSSTDIYVSMVEKGIILHYDGDKWHPVQIGAEELPHNVWGTSENNVFVLSRDGTILRYDGKSWEILSNAPDSDVQGPEFLSEDLKKLRYYCTIWGVSETDIFIGGNSGILAYYDGNNWLDFTSPENVYINDIWGTSLDNVFALDYRTILRFDGKEWIKTGIDTNDKSLFGIWGSSETDIFVVGEDGIILHYTGD
jgi:hypothetical protein